MDHNNNLIELKDIRFGYPTNPRLLDGLNFTLKKGDRIGIIGPNGCGKTTLLHIIMGLTTPHQGRVDILGKARVTQDDFVEVREKIGFLFQDSDDQLFCPSVKEEVAFGPLNFRKKHDEVEVIINDSLTRVDLLGFEQRAPYNMSGGEKRRLALATILAMKPRILLLDEPTLGLDEPTVEKTVEILHDTQLSYIIISQNREFLRRTTNKLYTIENGVMKDLDNTT
jgi:cobalt/nickel transport system ATP-binding protein